MRWEVRGAGSILSLPNFVWTFEPRSIACAEILHRGKAIVGYIVDVGGGVGGWAVVGLLCLRLPVPVSRVDWWFDVQMGQG